jgi:hypothetical protein
MDLGTTWSMTDTPDPNEYGFTTLHDPDAVAGWKDEPGDKGRPIAEKTLYKNWFLAESARLPLWGDYVFVGKSFRDDGAVVFRWFRNKTEAEKNTPYETFTEHGNHYWHPILHKVSFFADTKFPLATNGPDGGIILAARLYERIVMTPSMSEGTLFQHDLFFSGTKYVIGQYPVPSPSAVSWDYHGAKGGIQECLHGKLVFPPIKSAFASYSTGGGAAAAFGSSNGQEFPSTAPYEDWQPYVLSDKQQQVAGGWERHRITVFPPTPPDEVLR